MGLTSADLHAVVQTSYPSPNFVYLKEVRDATGFDAVRSADALAIGMYRSCGRLIHGFEMKVSRSDWLRELKDAAKAESLMRYCHHWSLIVPDESIVHDGELPPTWGLGIPHQSRKGAATRIKWIVKPPALEPQPPNMIFLSALIYAAQKVDDKAYKAALGAKYDEGIKHGQQDGKGRSDDLIRLKEAVDAFQVASGVSISQYTRPETASKQGSGFKDWLNQKNDIEQHRASLQRLKEQAERTLCGITMALAPLEVNT